MHKNSTMAVTRRLGLMVVMTAAVLLAGCAFGPRLVRTEVTNFNEWTSLPADRTYTFVRTLEFQNSLEVRSYEDLVRDELASQGFKLVGEPAQANLLVTLRPSVTTTQLRVRDAFGYDPFVGPFGGYGFYGRRFSGWYDPFWSPFDSFNSSTVDIAHRRFELDIDSRTVPGKRYYEGRVESVSDAPSLSAIAPSLVRALFVDFPGGNGQTRRVDVPMARP